MPDPFDLGLQLLPSDGGDFDAQTQLDEALGQYVSDEDDTTVQPFGRGWLFDFEAGDFVLAGSAPFGVSDEAQLRMWIEKTMRTARFAHPVYSDDYGTDYVDLIGRTPAPELLQKYATAITEALTQHDRISSVDGFKFAQGPLDDFMYASFTVIVDTDTPLPVANIQVGS